MKFLKRDYLNFNIYELIETLVIFRSNQLDEMMQFRQKSYWDWLGLLDETLYKKKIEIFEFLDSVK